MTDYFCPNFSNKKVLKEFNELKELVGEKGAYHVWNAQQGNSMEMTKNSTEQNPQKSLLFENLLKYYKGDRKKAIIAKAKIYTKSFDKWFTDGKLDSNGEPLVEETEDGNLVYTNKDGKQKSVDNKGSFLSNDTRLLDNPEIAEDITKYLDDSIDIANKQEIDGFIENYEQFFSNYDYTTEEVLNENMIKVVDKIISAFSLKLKHLGRNSVGNNEEMRAAINLQIQQLQSDLIDNFHKITNFIEQVNKDAIPTLIKINQIMKGNEQLPLKELINLKQDFFDFYKPLLDDAQSAIFAIENYKDYIGPVEYNNLRAKLQNTMMLFNSGSTCVNTKIVEKAKTALHDQGIKADSRTMEAYLRDQVEVSNQKLSSIVMWMGAMDKVKDEASRAIFDMTQSADNRVREYTLQKANKLLGLLDKVGRSNQKYLMEYDSNGVPTGYMVRHRNYGEKNRAFKEFQDNLLKELNILSADEIRSAQPEIRAEYNKRVNEWKADNVERKYVPEFYSYFDELPPIAQEARELIQSKIRKILNFARDKRGFIDTSKLNEQQKEELKRLRLEKKQLASTYDAFGNLKSGEELLIAQKLQDLNKKLSKGIKSKINQTLFDKVIAEKKESLSKEEFAKWHRENVRDEYTEQFYEDLFNLDKPKFDTKEHEELYNLLKEQKKEILKQYRDDNSHEIEYNIPNATQNTLDKIDAKLNNLLRRFTVKKRAGDNSLKFKDIAKKVPTKLYNRMLADAIETGTEQVFYQQYANYNPFTQSWEPKSYMTKIVPKLDKYIVRNRPTENFTEISEDSPFLNDKFKPFEDEINETELPKLSKYNNKAAYDQIKNNNLEELYNECVSTMDESNSKLDNLTYTNSYRLPQIEGGMWEYIKSRRLGGIIDYYKDKFSQNSNKNMDSNKNNDDQALIDEKRYFVPQNYTRQLQNMNLITRNTVGSIIEYARMSENFKQKTELKPKLQAIMQLLENRKYSGTGSKQGADNKIYKFAENFLKANVYGIKSKKSTLHIDEKHFSIFGHSIDVKEKDWNIAAIANSLKSLGTTVNLGLNFIVAGTGFFTASLVHTINALTGRFYSVRDSINGMKILATDLFVNNVGLVKANPNSKLMQLMKFFEVGQGIHTESTQRSNLLNWVLRNSLFGIYSLGDYFVKGSILGSVMSNFRFVNGEFINHEQFITKYSNEKDILDSWDSYPNIFDCIQYKNGTIQVVDDKYKTAWDKSKDLIGNTARVLSQSADGQLTPLQRAMMSSTILGSMAMMHRQFLPLIMQERFMQDRIWDYNTQRYREGLLKAPITLIQGIYRDKRNLSFVHKFKDQLTYDRKVLLKQLIVENMILSSLAYIIYPMIVHWAEKDDDDWRKRLIQFILMRTIQESKIAMTYWALPDVLNNIKSPFPIMSLFDNFQGMLGNIPNIYSIIDSSNTDSNKVKKGAYKGWDKSLRSAFKLTPLKNLWELQDIKSKMRYYQTQIIKEDPNDKTLLEQYLDTVDNSNNNNDESFDYINNEDFTNLNTEE